MKMGDWSQNQNFASKESAHMESMTTAGLILYVNQPKE
jgi:hypothetical protein